MTFFMTTPDTILNTVSTGMMRCKKSTGQLGRNTSIVSIYDPQNGSENASSDRLFLTLACDLRKRLS